MTQFPLIDNLGDARRARSEGCSGTIRDARLSWFSGDRRIPVTVVACAAAASLLAVSALRMPAIAIDGYASGNAESALLLPMMGQRYAGVWLLLAAVLASALVAIAAATWSGAPADGGAGNPALVAASAVLAVVALAVALYLFAHTADLARAALGVSGTGRILLPKGTHWQPGPLWPYVAAPGLALWTCLAAAIISLVPAALLGARLVVRAVRVRRAQVRPDAR